MASSASAAASPQRLTDAQLLERVARRPEDPVAAARAEGELYRRHVRYLFGVANKQAARLLQIAGVSAEDLVMDTFQRAFERAGTYRAEAGLDEEAERRRTRAWLGRIAQNQLVDSFRKIREVSASPYLEQVPVRDRDSSPPSQPSPQLTHMRQALSQLSEREQDILRVTALYWRAGAKQQRLPNEVAAELAARWETSSDNIRAIRSRAVKKLKTLMAKQGVRQEERS